MEIENFHGIEEAKNTRKRKGLLFTSQAKVSTNTTKQINTVNYEQNYQLHHQWTYDSKATQQRQ